jgi:citrate/tricarballylate utilization protein
MSTRFMNKSIPIYLDTPLAPFPLADVVDESRRVLNICNACRYCEGFCAVFPAVERRLDFTQADLHQLANLCHNCGACLYACQYADPHPFAVNVPRALARQRAQTYATCAWPRPFAALLSRQAAWVSSAVALGIAAFLGLMGARRHGAALAGADFYSVFPHAWLAALFGVLGLWVVLSLGVGVARFRRLIGPSDAAGALVPAAVQATSDALTLRYLDGGGAGCHNSDDEPGGWRRRFHHALAYGFGLCFAATCVATFDAYALGLSAPYPLLSLPVWLGCIGGVAMVAGAAGLLHLRLRRNPEQGDPSQRSMDLAFLGLLLVTAASGLVLVAARTTAAMPVLLSLHLGVVAALFVTLPYGKFVHAVYRAASLFQDAIERRRSASPALGEG